MYLNEKWFLKGRKGDAGALAASIGVSRHLASLLIEKLYAAGVLESTPARGAEVAAQCFGSVQNEDGGRRLSLADEAIEFLNPDMDRLYDAMSMKDMDKALSILRAAAEAQKKTLVIGDYDVDGIMGALILCRVLKKAINQVTHYIPHRVDDGYGINEKIVKSAYNDGVELIVTCDNGVSAHESIALAKSLGMQVIITDHHDIPDEECLSGADSAAAACSGDVKSADSADSAAAACVAVCEGYGVPCADAVVNPKRRDCGYPFKELCGAAVAYKLAIAFTAHMGVMFTDGERDELLCFAAIATICDIVRLVDENRRIAFHGLRLLNAGIRNPGLAALIKACGIDDRKLTSYEVGHILGPCINAAGRLDTAELSYDLFTESDPVRIGEIAAEMRELNRVRQDLTSSAFDRAIGEIGRLCDIGGKVMVLYLPGTHESICGIVAGKLKDRLNRPVIVLTDSTSGYLKGSGRSVDGYDLFDCVKLTRNLLVRYGGHKMAVGITLEKDKLPLFIDALNSNGAIDEDILTPKERVDICLDPQDITAALIGDVARLEPFGRGNERPVFALKGMAIEFASLIGKKKNVVKLKLRSTMGADSNSGGAGGRYGSLRQLLDAVFFGDVALFLDTLKLSPDGEGALISRGAPTPLVDVTFYPEINEYNGVRRIQLIVRSVRKADGAGACA